MNTHTYAVLEISPEAYTEILKKLSAAGYDDQLHGDLIDMHGIALKSELEPDGVHHCHCTAVHKCQINVHPDRAVHQALSDLVEAMSAYDERTGASSRVTLHSEGCSGDFHSHTFNNRPAISGTELRKRALSAIVAETDGIEILSDETILGTSERLRLIQSRGKLLDHPSVRKPVVDRIGFPVVEPSREIIDERYGFKNVKRDGDTITGELVVDFGSADLHLPATVEFKQKEQTINVGMDIGLTHDRIADGLSVPVLPVTDDHQMACKCSRHSVTHWIEAGCPHPSIRAHYP